MSTAILLAITSWDPKGWDERFRALAPHRDIRLWPDRVGEPSEIAYLCAWMAPRGLAAQFGLYQAQQRDRLWRDHHQPAANEVAVGIMGLGVLGRDAADVLRRLGFRVAGWSRTIKADCGIETFDGAAGLDRFLARTEILVCLLPHTPATEGILDLALLRKLRRDGALGGAYLINAGRGKLQVDADIVAALDEGSLEGATLDVFPVEPLAPKSPLWTHPKVTITPHNAAASDPRTLAVNVLDQIARVERGLPLENVVDRTAGY